MFAKLTFCIVMLAMYPVSASESTDAEINYLINFVSNSDCDFVRNGKTHSTVEAVKHIQKKYHHYENQIDSAEKFIELAATASTISNKKYTIKCPDTHELESGQWLLQELNRKRAGLAK